MSKEDIVILDSLNYIKGYRYELFCIIKLCQTTQCVVSLKTYSNLNEKKTLNVPIQIFENTLYEECLEFNKNRPEDQRYDQEVQLDLY